MGTELTQIRARIIAAARNWIGTPYHHQASLKSIGCDCVGLMLGVGREVYACEVPIVPPYTADWHEASGKETLVEECSRWLTPIAIIDLAPGDLACFRIRADLPIRHCAIVGFSAGGDLTMIHAYSRHAVREEALSFWWRRRVAAAFRFPEEPTWQG